MAPHEESVLTAVLCPGVMFVLVSVCKQWFRSAGSFGAQVSFAKRLWYWTFAAIMGVLGLMCAGLAILQGLCATARDEHVCAQNTVPISGRSSLETSLRAVEDEIVGLRSQLSQHLMLNTQVVAQVAEEYADELHVQAADNDVCGSLGQGWKCCAVELKLCTEGQTKLGFACKKECDWSDGQEMEAKKKLCKTTESTHTALPIGEECADEHAWAQYML